MHFFQKARQQMEQQVNGGQKGGHRQKNAVVRNARVEAQLGQHRKTERQPQYADFRFPISEFRYSDAIPATTRMAATTTSNGRQWPQFCQP